MTNSESDFETFVDLEKWSISLKNINELDHFNPLIIDDKEIEIKLMYNHSFEPSDTYQNGELSTYSEQLDPDYTIILKYNDIIKLIDRKSVV